MSEETYSAATEADEAERRRLGLLEERHDSTTFRHIDALGITEGWRCLEVGAGSGSVARWLAGRVGSNGKVVATDIDLRFLAQSDQSNVEVRQHDILSDPLEIAQYDLVHSRALLMHLPDPEAALTRMVEALRPGGWIVIEDMDFGPLLSSDVVDPTASMMVSTMRTVIDMFRRSGAVDPYFGRRERRLLDDLGFDNVGHEGWTHIVRGGGPHAEFALRTFQVGMVQMSARGLLSQEQVDSISDLYGDPNFYWIDYALISAWGRKPL